jgi:iron(III) transport system permease protein
VARLFQSDAWPAPETWPRLAALATNTGLLLAGTLLLAVPAGAVLAVLFERTDLPGRRLLWGLLVATLFVPLPLFTSAWQLALGAGGWLPVLAWSAQMTGWAPWAQGLVPAATVHALAGLPWVVLLVGRALRSTERDLEEDALLIRGPAWVLCHVTLPRCLGAVAAACLFVGLLTATEITVTDLMQVRTFAEEVYTQFTLSSDPTDILVARAITAALPAVALCVLLVLLLASQVERIVPAGVVQLRPAAVIALGAWRWPVAVVVWGVVLFFLVPPAGLVWRAGLAGLPPTWSVVHLVRQLGQTAAADGLALVRSLAVAALSGVLCAALALVGSWLAREARWFRLGLLALLAVAWATPGPVLGVALKGVIAWLLDTTGRPAWLERLLYYGPSPAPLVWVHIVRFLPFAVALVWPFVRLLPRELIEMARLDGAGPWSELTAVVAPLTLPAVWRAAVAVAALALGELSAGKLVSTPGAEGFAEMVFAQMHYGVSANLAAGCLLLLLAVLALSLGVGWRVAGGGWRANGG